MGMVVHRDGVILQASFKARADRSSAVTLYLSVDFLLAPVDWQHPRPTPADCRGLHTAQIKVKTATASSSSTGGGASGIPWLTRSRRLVWVFQQGSRMTTFQLLAVEATGCAIESPVLDSVSSRSCHPLKVLKPARGHIATSTEESS